MKFKALSQLCLFYAMLTWVSGLSGATYSQQMTSIGLTGCSSSSSSYSGHSGMSFDPIGVTSSLNDRTNSKTGYRGQMYEVTGLSFASTVEEAAEETSFPLAGRAVLDDGSFIDLQSDHVQWSVVSGPILEVSLFGVVRTSAVASDMSATLEAVWHGCHAFHSITVLDVIPDNYGSYAGDGISDSWQLNYFGLNNLSALPLEDPDGDGQANRFEFIAGLDPTDSSSFFRVRASVGSGPPELIFHPVVPGKIYTIQFRVSLLAGDWVELLNFTSIDQGAERTVVDDSAGSATTRFYRVEIE